MEKEETRKMIAAQQHKPGAPIEINRVDMPTLGAGEVLVKMFAAPINPSDLAYLTGTYTKVSKYPTTPGIEGSGTVVATGTGLLAKRLKGKNVMCSAGDTGGTWAQYMVTNATKCIPLGNEISLEEGATMIVNPLTALVMLEIAQNNKAAAIINTAASSSLGKMLLKLCQSHKLPIINIVHKAQHESKLKQLGATFVLNSSSPDFKEQLLTVSKKLRASIAFDAIGGNMTGSLLEAIQDGGEVKTYGGLSQQDPTFNNQELILRNKKITGLYLASYMKQAGILKALLLTGKVKKLVKNELKTTVNKKFRIQEINEAIAYYQSNMSKGKVLLMIDQS